jgi:hypothetical protein
MKINIVKQKINNNVIPAKAGQAVPANIKAKPLRKHIFFCFPLVSRKSFSRQWILQNHKHTIRHSREGGNPVPENWQ